MTYHINLTGNASEGARASRRFVATYTALTMLWMPVMMLRLSPRKRVRIAKPLQHELCDESKILSPNDQRSTGRRLHDGSEGCGFRDRRDSETNVGCGVRVLERWRTGDPMCVCFDSTTRTAHW